MVMSTLYFGSFNFFTLNSLNNLITDIKTLSPKVIGEYKAMQQARSKAELDALFAKDPALAP
ncbi:MAG: hypothetical protein ACFFC3_01665 [Candidatus Odinarchaeota archaeon]